MTATIISGVPSRMVVTLFGMATAVDYPDCIGERDARTVQSVKRLPMIVVTPAGMTTLTREAQEENT